MRFIKLSILFCFMFMAINSLAMKYQIKVLNTPTIKINDKEMKVGDWFDDKAIIKWGNGNQAMRVLSEDNHVYTLSAKLYKEIKANTFSDFILYTKPLAARGNNSQTLIEILEEKFDNEFIMLDEIVVELSSIELPKNLSIYFIFNGNKNKKGKFILSNSTAKLKRKVFNKMKIKQTGTLSIEVYMQLGQEKPALITDNMGIEIIPLDLDTHFEKSLPI